MTSPLPPISPGPAVRLSQETGRPRVIMGEDGRPYKEEERDVVWVDEFDPDTLSWTSRPTDGQGNLIHLVEGNQDDPKVQKMCEQRARDEVQRIFGGGAAVEAQHCDERCESSDLVKRQEMTVRPETSVQPGGLTPGAPGKHRQVGASNALPNFRGPLPDTIFE